LNPVLSIVIPTRDRPHLLPRAIASAQAQNAGDIEVIVVDDGSDPPVELPQDEHLRLVRVARPRGVAAARNTGLRVARGRWLAYLDDDDELLPGFAAVALDAVARSRLPPPVAVLSGLQVADADGRIIETRLPPTLPRGSHFFLEEPQPGTSFLSKQTLVVERELLLGIGGYDEDLRSRESTEMFLRLNPLASLQGIADVTYRQHRHSGARLSRDLSLRLPCFEQLLAKHRQTFDAHPRGAARFLLAHARTLKEQGHFAAAIAAVVHATRLAPAVVLGRSVKPVLPAALRLRHRAPTA
jgi:glycosyltransferase involved in cell wall biosynthesis